MARKRMIDPNIWCSEDVSKLSITARYLLIGMISNADDFGKGRANSSYLRSIIFPYDEIKSSAIEKALNEISKNISIQFYSINENQYYKFINWSKWQKVDHPANSIIPEPEDTFANNSRDIRETFAPNIIEENIREDKVIKERVEENVADAPHTPKKISKKIFIPPSFNEVSEYATLKGRPEIAKKFFDYFTADESRMWIDSKGEKVINWKQKMLTWMNYGQQSRASPYSLTSDIQRVIEVMEEEQ
jgi:hypothetical protein